MKLINFFSHIIFPQIKVFDSKVVKIGYPSKILYFFRTCFHNNFCKDFH